MITASSYYKMNYLKEIKYFLWGFLYLFINVNAYSQSQDYIPMQYVSSTEMLLIEKLEKQLSLDIEKLKNNRHKKKIIKIYRERTQSMIEKIRNAYFVFDSPINDYIQEVFDKILAANPELQALNAQVFISRYIWPNAYCIGEGSIIMNIGLIRRLENEDQIAFVLCHELAHLIKNHVNHAIDEHTVAWENLLDSKQFRKLKRQKYNRYESFQNILKELSFDHRRHSRTHEAEADAIGMSFFLKTDYLPKEAIRCLELLDEIDEEKYLGDLALKKTFNFADYPFKGRWLKTKRKGLSVMKLKAKKSLIDSLKTHPDCRKRIQLLSNKFLIQNLGLDTLSNIEYNSIQKYTVACDFEIIQTCYDFKDIGRCLYYSLQLLHKYPDHVYLRSMIGKCLHHIYIALKEHQLHTCLEHPSRQKTAYRQVLRFIHNLRLDELRKINYHFLASNQEIFQENEDYLFALILSNSEMEDNKKATNKYISQYLKLFPKGKYRKEILAITK